jgi:hypothetical protein
VYQCYKNSDRNRQNRSVRPVPDPNWFKLASQTAFDRFRTEPVLFAKEACRCKSKVIFDFFKKIRVGGIE